ncbi:sugar kinase [Streptomyces beihaiensis]|uniref:Sugar kinase n=1 Tax=Streptomyces beihaiensis TaxID=2984495 RepID=A0ABT3TZA9_9ACTN|nr:sugar kinase [Streptomyces beihaiensis]MCX3062392.1 sugar kinase [Streptomyces beihaiensis]
MTTSFDVVALGESMVTFRPAVPGRLAEVTAFERGIGGAESNVACGLAAAGHRTRWVGRVGADGFGDHLVEAVGAYGVDVTAVRRDPHRPTGVYFRTAGDRVTAAHEVAYYRAGSAASAMSTATVDTAVARGGRILHLTGITAALSDGCRHLLHELTAPRPGRPPVVSFDVNHRPGLWSRPDEAAQVLLGLARGADLVFVGEDEAEAVWGLRGPRAIRDAVPEPAVLVVKQGETGATLFERTPQAAVREATLREAALPGGATLQGEAALRGEAALPGGAALRGEADDTVTFVPAPRVDVVAAVGAGDAFAAGFLSATLRGLPAAQRLRTGHLWAAATLTAPGDLATPPSRAHADRLAALDPAAWETLHLGPGWTGTEAGAAEEVRTP